MKNKAMTAKGILLKYVTESRSDHVRKFLELVDYSRYILAMEEYAELKLSEYKATQNAKNQTEHIPDMILEAEEILMQFPTKLL